MATARAICSAMQLDPCSSKAASSSGWALDPLRTLDELHRLVAAHQQHVLLRGEVAQRIPDRRVMLVARRLRRVLQADEDGVDLMLAQPVERVFHGVDEIVDRHTRDRVIGAELPEDEVGALERDLRLQAFRRRRRDLARTPRSTMTICRPLNTFSRMFLSFDW